MAIDFKGVFRNKSREKRKINDLGRLGARRWVNIQTSLRVKSPEKVMKLLVRKRVSALHPDLHRLLNVIVTYEDMLQWQPHNVSHLLAAHACMMQGLDDGISQWRKSDVEIYDNGLVVHRPPPSNQVDHLVTDLLGSLKLTPTHPLVASCVFHYEFEKIHPFSGGNGRMGRLWQTLILSKWKPELAFLSVETVIRKQQDEYYAAFKVCDVTGFVEYMLKALLSAMQEGVVAPNWNQVGTKSSLISDQLQVLDNINGEMSLITLMSQLNETDFIKFKSLILNPLIDADVIELTIPNEPISSKQKYRIKMKTS